MPAGTVEITLDKIRHLRYDVNALADLEQKAGKSLQEILGTNAEGETDGVGLGFSALRLLLWAGLKWERVAPRVSVEIAGSILQDYIADGGNMDELGKKITEAFNVSGIMGEKDDSKKKEVGASPSPSSPSPSG